MMLFTPVINRIDTVKQQQLYFHHENQVPPEPTKPENNKPFSAEQVVTTQEKVLD
jgi:hypothetical protein